jgi:hypothetical protein
MGEARTRRLLPSRATSPCFGRAFRAMAASRHAPLIATLLPLAHRGHHVAVRSGIDDVGRLRSLGIEAHPLRREIERFEPDDWRARTRFGAFSSGLGQFGRRARFQLLDLREEIEAQWPDVLFVGSTSGPTGTRSRSCSSRRIHSRRSAGGAIEVSPVRQSEGHSLAEGQRATLGDACSEAVVSEL